MQEEIGALVLRDLNHLLAFHPHLTFFACSLYRNSWLGRLKWWRVFSSSSYHCQCSGPCLISRYSTVHCRSACRLGFAPLSFQDNTKPPWGYRAPRSYQVSRGLLRQYPPSLLAIPSQSCWVSGTGGWEGRMCPVYWQVLQGREGRGGKKTSSTVIFSVFMFSSPIGHPEGSLFSP